MNIKKTFRTKVTSSILIVLSLAVGLAPMINIDNKQASALAAWEADGWAQISSEGSGTSVCALSSGNGYCWGYNYYGQLGNSSTINSSTPVAVDTSGVLAGKTLQSITASGGHTCAIASDNQAYCWGANFNGQLGNNTLTDSSTPVAVDTSGVLAGKTLQSITAGAADTCAIASDNQAYCWGYNLNGQLGNSSTTNSSTPVAVDTSGVLAGKTLQSITAGNGHTCAIASDSQAYCWGGNFADQLGNGSSTTYSSTPVAVDTSGVLAGKTLQSMTAGGLHTCAIASDSQAYCWGYNYYGHLGNSSTTNSSTPVAVDTSGVLAGKTLQSITAGNDHTCAIASDNQAYCWGYNFYGRLGNSSTTDSSTPVAVDTSGVLAGKTLQSITAGNYHTCAIASDSQAYCWGNNVFGQLGNSSTTDSSTPVAVRDAMPLIVSNVVFSNQDNRTVLTITGTSFPSYTLAFSQSLISLNGQALPFCTGGTGATAEQFVNSGVDSANVSDTAPCYYLIDATGTVLMLTETNAQIWLPDTFDITAPGVVSVNGSPAFSFNQPATPGPSEPPIIVNPPEVVKIDSKETVSQATASRSPIVSSVEEDTSNSDSVAIATVTIEGKVLGDHTAIDARPTFTGKAPAGSKVTVTVHSDPVTCSTVADSEDNWSCTLAEALPDGDHTVRLAVVTPQDETYNYGPYDVTVGVSDDKPVAIDQPQEDNAIDSKQEMSFIPFIVGGVVLAVLIASIIIVKRLRH